MLAIRGLYPHALATGGRIARVRRVPDDDRGGLAGLLGTILAIGDLYRHALATGGRIA